MTRARDLADSADKDIAGTLTLDGLTVDGASVLIGHDTSQTIGANETTTQITGVDGSAGLAIARHQAVAGGPSLRFGKSRVSTKGDVTIVQDGDQLGRIEFDGADGTDIGSKGAQIEAVVDGTPSANDMPSKLIFSTTADGASSPTERMVIDSAGDVQITRGTEVQSLTRTLKIGGARNATGNDFVAIDFQNYDNNNSSTDYVGARISAQLGGSGGSDEGGMLVFQAGTGTATPVEVFRIQNNEVVVNDLSNDIDFRVESNNDEYAFFIDGADGNIGMSVSDPSSHIPALYFGAKRSLVSHNSGGSQVVMSRSDTSTAAGNYIGGYLFKTNDNSIDKFGGMICVADDTAGNGNLEFYGVSNAYESALEGHMQIDDTGDLYLRTGSIRVGRSHGNVYSSTEESVIIQHTGSGSNDTFTQMSCRDGTSTDPVFRHQRRGVIKSEIEEDGSFHSAPNSYGGTSDERLKENIVASGSQWDDIKAVQVKKYSWIEEGLDAPNQLGVIAQDLQAAGMGGLVKQTFKTDEEDNPVLDEDGNQEEYLSVKYSVLYMKAIKALQEAMAKIEVLETKVAALEAE